MANKYDQSAASISAGSARTARPSVRVDAVVFWTTVLAIAALVIYQTGYDHGFEAARVHPAACKDYSPEGKKLSSVQHDASKNITTCTYIRDVYGRGKWVQKI